MLFKQLLATLIATLILTLTGCGATDSGHADSQSANISDSGSTTDPGDTTDAAPVINTHPSSAYVYEGESTSFSVAASGTDLAYQWQKAINNEWVDLHNQNNSSLNYSYPTTVNSGLYRVAVSNSGGIVYSNAAEFIVKTSLTIEEHPKSVAAKTGSSADFYVSANGEGPYYYQWYKGSTKLSDNSKYVGSNTRHLVVNNLSASDQAYYSVKVTNDDGKEAKSSKAQLQVIQPAYFTSQISDITIIKNKNGTLSVSASGTAPIAYQWQKKTNNKWTNISGATSSSLAINNAQSADQGQYRCVINNISNSPSISNVATVSVIESAAIVSQPSDQYGSEIDGIKGSSLTLSVNGRGTDIKYSWYKNNQHFASGSSLTLSNISVADAGIYQCKVSNSVTTESCNPVELVVLTPPALTQQANSISMYEGKSAALEIDYIGSPVPQVKWYKDGKLLSNSSKKISFNPLKLQDAGNYTCTVTNKAGSAQCATYQVDVKEIVRIVKSPSNQLVTLGENAEVSVEATGTPPLTYQWYKDNIRIASGVDLASLSLSNATAEDEGTYYVVVSNEGSESVSSSADISVFQPAYFGEATLKWNPPQTRADGSPLLSSDILGYRVYHAQVADHSKLQLVEELSGFNNTQITIEHLEEGTHYFALTTIDADSFESGYSGMASITIKRP